LAPPVQVEGFGAPLLAAETSGVPLPTAGIFAPPLLPAGIFALLRAADDVPEGLLSDARGSALSHAHATSNQQPCAQPHFDIQLPCGRENAAG